MLEYLFSRYGDFELTKLTARIRDIEMITACQVVSV